MYYITGLVAKNDSSGPFYCHFIRSSRSMNRDILTATTTVVPTESLLGPRELRYPCLIFNTQTPQHPTNTPHLLHEGVPHHLHRRRWVHLAHPWHPRHPPHPRTKTCPRVVITRPRCPTASRSGSSSGRGRIRAAKRKKKKKREKHWIIETTSTKSKIRSPKAKTLREIRARDCTGSQQGVLTLDLTPRQRGRKTFKRRPILDAPESESK